MGASPASTTFAGVDWSRQHHAVCVVDDHGARVDEATVPHSRPGLSKITTLLRRHDVTRVGIERGDGPVVEHLLREGFEVVVISARQVKSLRSRYGSAGNKDDRFDAFVLADALRTDAGRWAIVRHDTPETVALRMLVRARQDLVGHRIAVHNQLLAVLQHNFPGAIGLFSGLDIPISLTFLGRFPTEAKAAWLSEVRLAHWLKANGYFGRKPAADLLGHLREAATGRLDGAAAEASEVIVLALVDLLSTLRQQQGELETRIKEALLAHPDGPIFQSLHRSGTVRAATLLAEIGDCRARFPDPSPTAAAATNTSAQPWSTGHKTHHEPTPGPATPTTAPANAEHATPTPHGSWPRAGQDPLAMLDRPPALQPRPTRPTQRPPTTGRLT